MISSAYQIGGSLPPDNPTYVTREADEELYQALKAGKFCYVLNSRQMGKSSLRVRTMDRLQKEGVACAEIDITEIGSVGVTQDEWYIGVISLLTNSFGLTEFDLLTWWDEHLRLSCNQRLSQFIKDILLPSTTQQIVIFIDEIDSVLSLDFSLDDFFALIRAFYNKRVDHPQYQRLSFCLLGVATPSDLIQDKKRTPFNIGQAIDLKGFKLANAQPLIEGLEDSYSQPQQAQQLMGQILDWTGGQPFLTQKLCKLMVEEATREQPRGVEEVVKDRIISNWDSQDEPEHLRTIRNRLFRQKEVTIKLLELYQSLWKNNRLEVDNSREQIELRLSGLVVKEAGILRNHNRIYREIFNDKWIAEELKKLKRKYKLIDRYHVGGSLPADSLSYVTREADEELYQALRASKYCYVFSSRQTGKSSLRVRTIQKLQQEGFACAEIDITEIGSVGVTQDEWYVGIISLLSDSFGLTEFDLVSWWDEHLQLSPSQRFDRFIEEVLLTTIPQQIVIFIDEIDSLFGLDFSLDDFFGSIRNFYDKREDDPEYNRLSFCFLGVVSPSNLVQDDKLSPFNIYQEINLQGFKLEELQPLIGGLTGKVENPQAVMQEILYWTGGQPFLTQKVCQLIVDKYKENEYFHTVDEVIRKKILERWKDQDEPMHLWTIEQRLLRNKKWLSDLLSLYQQILNLNSIVFNDSREHIELQLSGLVIKENGILRASNRICREVFNIEWIQQQFKEIRPYKSNIEAWLNSNYQDESRLLQGNALREALEWSSGKPLSVEDSRFLNTSQELTRRELEKEKIILTEANETLDLAKKQESRNKTKGYLSALLILILGIITSAMLSIKYNHNRKLYLSFANTIKEEIIQGSKRGKKVLGVNKDEGSSEILRAAKRLKILYELTNEDNKYVKGKPTTQVITSLMYSIYGLPFREFKILDDHEQTAISVAFSPDNKLLATASLDQTIKLWNLQGKLIQTFEGHDDKVMSVVFSPDSKTIASSSNDKTIKLWDLQGNVIQTLEGHTDKVRNISFSPDGNMIASASWDNKVFLWAKEGKNKFEMFKPLEGHTYNAREVSFSPDGKLIATASYDKNIIIWTRNGEYIKTLQGHTDELRSIDFSPKNSNLLASAGKDWTIKLWNIEQEKVIKDSDFDGNQDTVFSVRFSPDGKTLASGHWDEKIKLWDLEGELLQTIEGYDSVYEVNFSFDGNIIASAHRNGLVKLWKQNIVPPLITVDSQESPVTSVALNSEDNLIAAASKGKIKLWNLQGKLINTLDTPESQVSSIGLNLGGNLIATASKGKISLWNLQGKLINTLDTPESPVTSISLNSQSNLIATANKDKIKLWNLQGKLINTLDTPESPVSSIALNSEGNLIAAASKGKIQLWNLQDESIKTFKVGESQITSISFSPNLEMFVTATIEGKIHFWSLEGEKLATIPGHSRATLGVNFSADGDTLIASGSDEQGKTSIKLWKLDLDSLINKACESLQEYLKENSDPSNEDLCK